MDKDDIYFSDDRLQTLKQATLINYFDEMTFLDDESRNLELLDTMLRHLCQGDLDFCFQSNFLKGVDTEEKAEIFKLARKYKDLCFYDGNPDFWLDSVDGVTLGGQNADFVCMKILDNFDFLLGLAKDGGEDALKLVRDIKGEDAFSDLIIIDALRNYSLSDDSLSEIIVEMSKTDGDYKHFNNSEKACMLKYPNGVLFKYEDGSLKRVPVSELDKKIGESYDLEDSQFDYYEVLNVISNKDFEELIFQIYFDELNKKDKVRYI